VVVRENALRVRSGKALERVEQRVVQVPVVGDVAANEHIRRLVLESGSEMRLVCWIAPPQSLRDGPRGSRGGV
jgi:hypothetical protein